MVQISTVLYWQPPDIQIFHTDASLILAKYMDWFVYPWFQNFAVGIAKSEFQLLYDITIAPFENTVTVDHYLIQVTSVAL